MNATSSSSEPLVPPRRWTCQLCAQKRNTEDNDRCMTCGRPRGHNPEKYQQRLQEIRKWSEMAEGGFAMEQEGGGLSDSWGLCLGIAMLMLMIGLLVWAHIQDENEAASQAAESYEL
mmetsp:Transcript_52509/g.125452  ORF Transcript_52509/g.125452 Transcript_52509/m.125452 type:complete len:117 (+) Transcript_52509:102-452(+)